MKIRKKLEKLILSDFLGMKDLKQTFNIILKTVHFDLQIEIL